MLSEIGQFLWSVFTHWQAYVTGGGITAIIAVFERLTSWRLSRRNYKLLVTIGFLSVAVFLAWRDEHIARAKLEVEFTPQFIREIDETAIAGRVSNDMCATTLESIIQMDMRNGGADSTVRGYALAIENGGHSVAARSIRMPFLNIRLS